MRIDLISELLTAIWRFEAGTEFGMSITIRSGAVNFMILGVTAPDAAISTWKPSLPRARLTLRTCTGRPLGVVFATGSAALVSSGDGEVAETTAIEVTRSASVLADSRTLTMASGASAISTRVMLEPLAPLYPT